jgi:uncharacterized protein
MKAIILVVLMSVVGLSHASPVTSAVNWQSWADTQFELARVEKKLVILDLEAVWCHWCHVMDQTTYQDSAVAALLSKHFIAVKVDHDARPDLAERYRDFGWPATIIFDSEGRELVKRAGYIEPVEMQALLRKLIDNPVVEEGNSAPLVKSYANNPLLDDQTRGKLQRQFVATHDKKLGGLKHAQKYLERDTAEYALMLALRGDQQAEKIAREDLTAAMALIDPVWGGVYQYSTHGDWKHAHYEKLGVNQAEYIRLYALAYTVLREPRYLAAAKSIHQYSNQFLRSNDGVYFVSQDADLTQGQKAHDYFKLGGKARRKRGIPRIDTHQYSKQNGLMVEALATLYSVTGDAQYLQDAQRAYTWIQQQRRLPSGGFSHDAQDQAGPYLADNLAVLRASLALYTVTGDRAHLTQSRDVVNFIDNTFRSNDRPGYISAITTGLLTPISTIDENIALTRALMRVHHYSGEMRYKQMAEYALRYLVTPDIALSRLTEVGILLAEIELSNDPTHLTIVGHKDHPSASALFKTALAYPTVYRRIEWWDTREGAMPNPDVKYPELDKPAAYVCTDGRCSLPLFQPQDLQRNARASTKTLNTLN